MLQPAFHGICPQELGSHETSLKPSSKLEFRAEAFNAFNSPIHAGPSVNVTSPQFAVVALDQQNFPRNMQFALRLRF